MTSPGLSLAVVAQKIAVDDDAPLPAMKTTEDFVAFMKATPSIAYRKAADLVERE